MLKQSLALIKDIVSKHAEESILSERDKKSSFKIWNDSVSCLLNLRDTQAFLCYVNQLTNNVVRGMPGWEQITKRT